MTLPDMVTTLGQNCESKKTSLYPSLWYSVIGNRKWTRRDDCQSQWARNDHQEKGLRIELATFNGQEYYKYQEGAKSITGVKRIAKDQIMMFFDM
jgi:hypothetical protein